MSFPCDTSLMKRNNYHWKILLRMLWLPKRKIIKLEENNVEVKIVNWTFKIGEIAELKNANGQSLA